MTELLQFLAWFFGPIFVCMICTEIAKWIRNREHNMK